MRCLAFYKFCLNQRPRTSKRLLTVRVGAEYLVGCCRSWGWCKMKKLVGWRHKFWRGLGPRSLTLSLAAAGIFKIFCGLWILQNSWAKPASPPLDTRKKIGKKKSYNLYCRHNYKDKANDFLLETVGANSSYKMKNNIKLRNINWYHP